MKKNKIRKGGVPSDERNNLFTRDKKLASN